MKRDHICDVVPQILVHRIVVLSIHHSRQSEQEGHPSELYEQQRILPTPFPFGIFSEDLRDGDRRKVDARDDASYQEQEHDGEARCPQVLPTEQGADGYLCQFFDDFQHGLLLGDGIAVLIVEDAAVGVLLGVIGRMSRSCRFLA